MNGAYYQKKLFVAQVDKKNNITGKVERWKAHTDGILHRGFTVVLMYNGQYILQHRKHKAFDKQWDFTFSSHQPYENGKLQTDLDAIYKSLRREWDLNKSDLGKTPAMLGTVYYKAKDLDSIYTEHEFDYIYLAKLKKLPLPNSDYCYGFKLVDTVHEILTYTVAPWVIEIIKSIPFDNK